MRVRDAGLSEVLGVAVQPSLLQAWRSWFAPVVQPFLVDSSLRASIAVGVDMKLPMELRDTFLL